MYQEREDFPDQNRMGVRLKVRLSVRLTANDVHHHVPQRSAVQIRITHTYCIFMLSFWVRGEQPLPHCPRNELSKVVQWIGLMGR